MNHLYRVDSIIFCIFKVTLMSELGSCMKMALKLILGDVINGRRMAGREGGCSGPLEVTGIGGHGWGTLTALTQCSVCVIPWR